MSVVGGHCGKCGAPYFFPAVWNGVNPPPPQPSCACWTAPQIRTQGSVAITLQPETAAQRYDRLLAELDGAWRELSDEERGNYPRRGKP
jgi:hypothetical protein